MAKVDPADIARRALDVAGAGTDAVYVTLDMDVLDQVPAAIETALRQEALTPELHWLRLAHRRTADGEVRCEALLDNEPWAAGTQALATLAWPAADLAYTARNFILLDVRDY